MSKRETDKIITIGKRKFKIEKFDALTGSYIVFTLLEKVAPLFFASEEEKKTDTKKKKVSEEKDGNFKKVIANLLIGRTLLTREEFMRLQKDCLSVVSEVLPAGPRPIIGANNEWGVADIERNAQLAIVLTIHALAFNVADFFGGQGLQELKASLVGIFPANMPTSTDTLTPQ